MANGRRKWLLVAVTIVVFGVLMAVTLGSAQRIFLGGNSVSTESWEKTVHPMEGGPFKHHMLKSSIGNFFWRPTVISYQHVWSVSSLLQSHWIQLEFLLLFLLG